MSTMPLVNPPSPRLVIEAVCVHYDIDRLTMAAHWGERSKALPRQVAMYLAHRLSGATFAAIGRLLGGRDPSTVAHGAEKIRRLLVDDAGLQADVEAISIAVAHLAAQPLALTGETGREPLTTALDLLTNGRALVSHDAIVEMAMCLVGYARSAGHLSIDGDPMPPTRLGEQVDAVRAAYSTFAVARHTPGEKAALDGLSTALLGLFEARSNAQEA